MIETTYKIKLVKNVKDKDLAEALDIYMHGIDEYSETSTNEIRNHIQNSYDDNRDMFFYILYLDNRVAGFAEFGYLPKSEALIIDYLCSKPRNHVLFYSFYHMILNDIEEKLKKNSQFIKYIITELSLKKDKNDKYIDVDSNYFRQLLSVEKFKILKAPYYQPYCNCNQELKSIEFNLAVKPMINGLFSETTLDKDFYLELVRDIYMNHYASWYKKYIKNDTVNQFFYNLFNRICKEYPNKIEIDEITLVNCILFQNGQCQQIQTENITIKKECLHHMKQYLLFGFCVLFSALTAFFCYCNYFSKQSAFICSLFTIISSVISLVNFIKENFFGK